MSIRLGERFLDEMKYQSYDEALDFFYKIEEKTIQLGESKHGKYYVDESESISDSAVTRHYRRLAYDMYTVFKRSEGNECNADFIVNELLNYLACALIATCDVKDNRNGELYTDTNPDNQILTDNLRQAIVVALDYSRYISDYWKTFDLMKLKVKMPNREHSIRLIPNQPIDTIEDFVSFFMTVLRYNFISIMNEVSVHLIKYKEYDQHQQLKMLSFDINTALNDVEAAVSRFEHIMDSAKTILSEDEIQQYQNRLNSIIAKGE